MTLGSQKQQGASDLPIPSCFLYAFHHLDMAKSTSALLGAPALRADPALKRSGVDFLMKLIL